MDPGKIFISYARADASEFAAQLAADLQGEGLEVWFDQQELQGGENFNIEIEKAMEQSTCVLLVITQASITSRYVVHEMNYALDEGKMVIPILRFETKLPFRLRGLHYVNFVANYKTGFGELLKALSNYSTDRNAGRSGLAVAQQPTTAGADGHTGGSREVIRKGSFPHRAILKAVVPLVALIAIVWLIPSAFRPKKQKAQLATALLKYDAILPYNEELAAVQKDGRWGFADTLGRLVISPGYQHTKGFQFDHAAVAIGGKWGFINRRGEKITGLLYDSVYSFQEGVAAVKRGEKWRYIDTTGETVFNREFDGALTFLHGLAPVRIGNKWGFINGTGTLVVPAEFQDVDPFSENVAAVQKEGKWGFVDRNGKVIIPCKYDKAFSVRMGLAAVKANGKYGFIDMNDSAIIRLQYDMVKDYSEGMAAVNSGGRWGYIDLTGKLATGLKYSAAGSFYEGMAAVSIGNKWGYIDAAGKEVISPKYNRAYDFYDGLAAVATGPKWGFVNKNGTETVPVKFDMIDYLGRGLLKASLRSEKVVLLNVGGEELASKSIALPK